MSPTRRGFTRLWIVVCALWALIVGGLFLAEEADRPVWKSAPLALPAVFVDPRSGKFVRSSGGSWIEADVARNDIGDWRAWDGQRWQPVPAPLPSRIGLFDDLLPGKFELSEVQRQALQAVKGDTTKLSREQYHSILLTVSGWRDFHVRFPDGEQARITARMLDDATAIAKQHWEDHGGWLGHRWTKWLLLGLLLPVGALYVLGWIVGWIVSGFRSQ